jgi:hypothetical protein
MTRTHCAVPIVLFVLLLDAISRGTARRVLVRRFPYLSSIANGLTGWRLLP